MKKIIINIINSIPGIRFLIKFLYVLKIDKKLYKYSKFNGKFKVKLSNNSSFKMFGFESIYCTFYYVGLYNKWEKISIKLWENFAKYSNCIFDVGSNVGIYSLVAATVNEQSKIFAFEPDKIAFNRLYNNIQLNKFDVSLNNVVVSDKSGFSTFYQNNNSLISSLEKDLNSFPIELESVSLNDFCSKINNFPQLIKIDVEGFENLVLDGMVELFKFEPIILVEILPKNFQNMYSHLLKILPSNFLTFGIDENVGIYDSNYFFDISKYRNYLIIPQSKMPLLDEITKKESIIIYK
ncbi:MAG TPA: FkbM family methyltransferase [Ignavibacteria bacterium]|nr:FkbM family methyltransferase [Ignavibacteria bacterium]